MSLRAVLMLPAGASLADADACGADAVILEADDLRSAAPPAGLRFYPRIGPLDEPRSVGDLEAAVAARPAGIALPLSRSGADVQRLGARLAVLEAEHGLPDGAIRILAFATEAPEALFELKSYREASARLEGLIFTDATLAAALRFGPGRLARAPAPLRWAREMTLVAARAAGVLALDGPCLSPDAAAREAEIAQEDGFDGKLAGSLAEVAAIRKAFEGRA